MRKIFLFLSLLVLLLPVPYSYGFSTKGEDCSKCHTLTKDDAAALLKDLIPNVKVLEVRVSPVKGIWEVDIDSGGRKGPTYIDFSKKYLVAGSIVDIKEKKNLTQERLSEINKVDVSQIPLSDALVMGDKDAKHKVIVFDDPDCPYCAKLHQEMKQVIAERKDIAFYIKMFPLPMHKGAYDKAKAIVCEKSLALLEDAFAGKELPKPKCETKVIDENINLAQKLGISGTPALILPDGKVIPGYKDAKGIMEMIGN
ncbi:MAG: DsbC family protein [Nitrospirae bacterium]|nr:DsbC family protein [Nitrospirota bacterium]